jgi:hypothetical protein
MRHPVNLPLQRQQDWRDHILPGTEQIGVNLTTRSDQRPIPTIGDRGWPLDRRKAVQQIALKSSGFAGREGGGEALAAIPGDDARESCVGL